MRWQWLSKTFVISQEFLLDTQMATVNVYMVSSTPAFWVSLITYNQQLINTQWQHCHEFSYYFVWLTCVRAIPGEDDVETRRKFQLGIVVHTWNPGLGKELQQNCLYWVTWCTLFSIPTSIPQGCPKCDRRPRGSLTGKRAVYGYIIFQ